MSSNDTYTATGAEGLTLTRTSLIGKDLLLVIVGSYPLKKVLSSPGVTEYSFDMSTGVITFGTEIQESQVIQTIYK